MAFQLANISHSLGRAAEASLEAIRKLEYCHAQVNAARTVLNEPLPEEEEILGAIEAIQRIEHKIRSRFVFRWNVVCGHGGERWDWTTND